MPRRPAPPRRSRNLPHLVEEPIHVWSAIPMSRHADTSHSIFSFVQFDGLDDLQVRTSACAHTPAIFPDNGENRTIRS